MGVLTPLPTALSQRAARPTIIGVKTSLHNDDPDIDDQNQRNVNVSVNVNVNVNVNADPPEKERGAVVQILAYFRDRYPA